MGARKLYKSHQEKKAAEADDEAHVQMEQAQTDGSYLDPGQPQQRSNSPKPGKESKPICPSCGEKKKVDFTITPDAQGERTTVATCMKCGTQWRHK